MPEPENCLKPISQQVNIHVHVYSTARRQELSVAHKPRDALFSAPVYGPYRHNPVRQKCRPYRVLAGGGCTQVDGSVFVVYNVGLTDHVIRDRFTKLNDRQYHVVRFTRVDANSTLQIDDHPVHRLNPTGARSVVIQGDSSTGSSI